MTEPKPVVLPLHHGPIRITAAKLANFVESLITFYLFNAQLLATMGINALNISITHSIQSTCKNLCLGVDER